MLSIKIPVDQVNDISQKAEFFKVLTSGSFAGPKMEDGNFSIDLPFNGKVNPALVLRLISYLTDGSGFESYTANDLITIADALMITPNLMTPILPVSLETFEELLKLKECSETTKIISFPQMLVPVPEKSYEVNISNVDNFLRRLAYDIDGKFMEACHSRIRNLNHIELEKLLKSMNSVIHKELEKDKLLAKRKLQLIHSIYYRFMEIRPNLITHQTLYPCEKYNIDEEVEFFKSSVNEQEAFRSDFKCETNPNQNESASKRFDDVPKSEKYFFHNTHLNLSKDIFMKRFYQYVGNDEITNRILHVLQTDQVIVAGGSLVTMLNPEIKKKPYNDLDIWVLHSNEKLFKKVCEILLDEFKSEDVIIGCKESVVTIRYVHCPTFIQIVLSGYHCGLDLVSSFDGTYLGGYFDGKDLKMTIASVCSLLTKTTYPITETGANYQPRRHWKLMDKGFSLLDVNSVEKIIDLSHMQIMDIEKSYEEEKEIAELYQKGEKMKSLEKTKNHFLLSYKDVFQYSSWIEKMTFKSLSTTYSDRRRFVRGCCSFDSIETRTGKNINDFSSYEEINEHAYHILPNQQTLIRGSFPMITFNNCFQLPNSRITINAPPQTFDSSIKYTNIVFVSAPMHNKKFMNFLKELVNSTKDQWDIYAHMCSGCVPYKSKCDGQCKCPNCEIVLTIHSDLILDKIYSPSLKKNIDLRTTESVTSHKIWGSVVIEPVFYPSIGSMSFKLINLIVTNV